MDGEPENTMLEDQEDDMDYTAAASSKEGKRSKTKAPKEKKIKEKKEKATKSDKKESKKGSKRKDPSHNASDGFNMLFKKAR